MFLWPVWFILEISSGQLIDVDFSGQCGSGRDEDDGQDDGDGKSDDNGDDRKSTSVVGNEWLVAKNCQSTWKFQGNKIIRLNFFWVGGKREFIRFEKYES